MVLCWVNTIVTDSAPTSCRLHSQILPALMRGRLTGLCHMPHMQAQKIPLLGLLRFLSPGKEDMLIPSGSFLALSACAWAADRGHLEQRGHPVRHAVRKVPLRCQRGAFRAEDRYGRLQAADGEGFMRSALLGNMASCPILPEPKASQASAPDFQGSIIPHIFLLLP